MKNNHPLDKNTISHKQDTFFKKKEKNTKAYDV